MVSFHRHAARRGSSLLEITSLIVILGLLAAVAFPIVDRMNENIRNRHFVDDVSSIREAVSIYYTEHGDYPAAQATGTAPEGIEDYLDRFDWDAPTPFGGEWEWIRNRHDVISAIAVRDPDVSEDHLRRFDAAEDDGNLHTGQFRFISEIRYAYVLEDGSERE